MRSWMAKPHAAVLPARLCQCVCRGDDARRQVGRAHRLHLGHSGRPGQADLHPGSYLVTHQLAMSFQFKEYELAEPNDCNYNYLQIFDGKTDIEGEMKIFCGSIADALTSETNIMYVR